MIRILSLRRSGVAFCFATAWLFVILVAAPGCSQLQTSYGTSEGYIGRNSINGFYGLRRAFEFGGYETHDVRQFSRRTGRNDVVVWIPRTNGAFNTEVTDWIDNWLSEPDRTLVFVVPDSGSEVDFWDATRPNSPAEDRLDYRRQQARAVNRRLNWRLNRRDIPSNGWFITRALEHRTMTDSLAGPWSDDIVLPEQESDDLDLSGFQVEYDVVAFDEDENKSIDKTSSVGFSTTGPSSSYLVTEDVAKPDGKEATFKSLLSNDAGDALVGEVTRPGWPDSRLIVVGGGSLLTNFALHRTANDRLAKRMVRATVPDGPIADDESRHVAFLVSATTFVPVYQETSGPPRASGMELLAVWPLSLVTIHATILGLIACLVLLPIFGRPRKRNQASSTDFGDHLDAVAALMTKTSSDDYALHRIREYARMVGGKES